MAAVGDISAVTVYARNCPGLTINVGDVNLSVTTASPRAIPADVTKKDVLLDSRPDAGAGTLANLSPETCAVDLLRKLGREIQGDTLDELLLVYKVAIGCQGDLDIKSGFALLGDMQDRGCLGGGDFIFLQYLLLNCEKFDHYERLTSDIQKSAEENNMAVSYLHSPDLSPVEGFRYAHFHVKLKDTVVDKNYLVGFKSQLADLLGASKDTIIVPGVTPSDSLWITFLLPETAVLAIVEEERRERVGAALQALGVDQIDLGQQRPAGRGRGSRATAGEQSEGTSQASDHRQHNLDSSGQLQSDSSDSQLRELTSTLFTCDVCKSPFDSNKLKPLLLQCSHSFCSECLDRLGKAGDFACPQCRSPVPFKADLPACQQFEVDHTRLKVLDSTQALQRGERGHHSPPDDSQRGEVCDTHPGEELSLFCTTCKKLLCPSCAQSHDVTAVCAFTKFQLEKACNEVQQLLSSVEQAASDVSSELGALGSKEEAALEKMDEAFDRLEACLRHRRQTAREELKARVKQDRVHLEDVLASHESLLSAAHSTLHFGRRVVQLGSDSDLMLGLEQVQAALRELATRGQQATVTPVQYQVNTKDLSVLTQAMSSFGEVNSDHASPSLPLVDGPPPCAQSSTGELHGAGLSVADEADDRTKERDEPMPHPPEVERPDMTSPRTPTTAGFTDEDVSKELEFVCQEFQFDLRRCGPRCSVDVTRTILVNKETDDVLPWLGACRFFGTLGTLELTRNSFWEVRISAEARGDIAERKAWCEVGVTGEGAIRNFSGKGSVADCYRYAAAIVNFAKRNTQIGVEARCQGRRLGRVAVAEFHPRLNQFLLGMLWDATHHRLFFIDVCAAEVMFQAELDTTEPLSFMCNTQPVSHCGAEVKVELLTGGRVQMSDEKRNLIQRLLHQ